MNLLSYFLHFSCEVYKSCNEYLHVMKLRCSDFRQNLHTGSHTVPTDITTFLLALLTFHLIVDVRLSAQNYPIDRLSPNFMSGSKSYRIWHCTWSPPPPRLCIISRRVRDNEKPGRRSQAEEESYNIFSHIYFTRKKTLFEIACRLIANLFLTQFYTASCVKSGKTRLKWWEFSLFSLKILACWYFPNFGLRNFLVNCPTASHNHALRHLSMWRQRRHVLQHQLCIERSSSATIGFILRFLFHGRVITITLWHWILGFEGNLYS